MAQQLDLWPDQSFHLLDGDQGAAGRWYADPSRDGIVLGLADGERVLEVRNSRTLRPVGEPDGESADLVASDEFAPAFISLSVSGMLTYFADAATLYHCATGRTHPIAQDADYLAIEEAYLANRPGPAEPLFVTLDGRIELREQMEGPDRLTIVPDALTGV